MSKETPQDELERMAHEVAGLSHQDKLQLIRGLLGERAKMMRERDTLRAQCKIMREALAMYANPKNYCFNVDGTAIRINHNFAADALRRADEMEGK